MTAMTNELDNYPLVHIPGSEIWEDGYELGNNLDNSFPNQEGLDLGYAIAYHPHPDLSSGIAMVLCTQVGMNDGGDWIWKVTLGNNERYEVQGGCDYTGWDCRSSCTWTALL